MDDACIPTYKTNNLCGYSPKKGILGYAKLSCFPSFLLCEKFKGNEAWIIVYQRFVIFLLLDMHTIQFVYERTLYFCVCLCVFVYLHNRTNRWRVSREMKKIGKLATKLWKFYRKGKLFFSLLHIFCGLWMWTKWKICIFLNTQFQHDYHAQRPHAQRINDYDYCIIGMHNNFKGSFCGSCTYELSVIPRLLDLKKCWTWSNFLAVLTSELTW